MGRKNVRTGCCEPAETPRSYEDSVELGNRRRALVVRFSAAASASLLLAALVLRAAGGPAQHVTANRLMWTAALFGLPLLLVQLRRLLVTRRASWHLGVAAGLIVVGVLGFPAITAAAVVATLGWRVLRPESAHTCASGCAEACCVPVATPQAR